MDGRRDGGGGGGRWRPNGNDNPVSSYASLASGPPPSYARSGSVGSWEEDEGGHGGRSAGRGRGNIRGGRGRGRFDGGRGRSFRGGRGRGSHESSGRGSYNSNNNSNDSSSTSGGRGGGNTADIRAASVDRNSGYESGEVVPLRPSAAAQITQRRSEERTEFEGRGGIRSNEGRGRGGRFFNSMGGRDGNRDGGRGRGRSYFERGGRGRSTYKGRGRGNDSLRDPQSSGGDWMPGDGRSTPDDMHRFPGPDSGGRNEGGRGRMSPQGRSFGGRSGRGGRGGGPTINRFDSFGEEQDFLPEEDRFAKRRRDEPSTFSPPDHEDKRMRDNIPFPPKGPPSRQQDIPSSKNEPPFAPRLDSRSGFPGDSRGPGPQLPVDDMRRGPPPIHDDSRGGAPMHREDSRGGPMHREDSRGGMPLPRDASRGAFRDDSRGPMPPMPPMHRDEDRGGMPPMHREDSRGGTPPIHREDSRGGMPPVHREDSRGSVPLNKRDDSRGSVPLNKRDDSRGSVPLNKRDDSRGSVPLNKRDDSRGPMPMHREDTRVGIPPMHHEDSRGRMAPIQRENSFPGQPGLSIDGPRGGAAMLQDNCRSPPPLPPNEDPRVPSIMHRNDPRGGLAGPPKEDPRAVSVPHHKDGPTGAQNSDRSMGRMQSQRPDGPVEGMASQRNDPRGGPGNQRDFRNDDHRGPPERRHSIQNETPQGPDDLYRDTPGFPNRGPDQDGLPRGPDMGDFRRGPGQARNFPDSRDNQGSGGAWSSGVQQPFPKPPFMQQEQQQQLPRQSNSWNNPQSSMGSPNSARRTDNYRNLDQGPPPLQDGGSGFPPPSMMDDRGPPPMMGGRDSSQMIDGRGQMMDGRGRGRGRGRGYLGRGRGRSDFARGGGGFNDSDFGHGGGRGFNDNNYGGRGRGFNDNDFGRGGGRGFMDRNRPQFPPRDGPDMHQKHQGQDQGWQRRGSFNDINAMPPPVPSAPQETGVPPYQHLAMEPPAQRSYDQSIVPKEEPSMTVKEEFIVPDQTASEKSTPPAIEVKAEPERPPTPPIPVGEPSGAMSALVRWADLEEQMQYAYAKHMQLIKRHNILEAQTAVLEELPVGWDAFKDDFETLIAADKALNPDTASANEMMQNVATLESSG